MSYDSELPEYATRRGWEIAEIDTDNGVSGSKDSRPALRQPVARGRRQVSEQQFHEPLNQRPPGVGSGTQGGSK